MAVVVNLNANITPGSFLEWLKEQIRGNTIRSWSVDANGNFLHHAQQVDGFCGLQSSTIGANAIRFSVGWVVNRISHLTAEEKAEMAAELQAHAVRMILIHGVTLSTRTPLFSSINVTPD